MANSNSFRRSLCSFLAVLTMALFAPVSSASHSWGGYHWARTFNPFTLKLGDNVTYDVWLPSLNGANLDWIKSTVLDTSIVPGQSSGRRCRATVGQVEVCNSTYGSTGWLGIASISVSGLHITQGTVKLNDTYFNTSTYNTPAWRSFVTCQEIGHTLGLDHQDTNFTNQNLGSCMDYTNDPSTNQHPNVHDYNELVSIYGHVDSSTSVSQSVNLLAAMGEFNSPREWGRLVRTSANGRNSVYELDFGNGNRIYTFVVWSLITDSRRP